MQFLEGGWIFSGEKGCPRIATMFHSGMNLTSSFKRRCVARVGVAAIFRLGLKILALHLLLPSQPYTGTTAVFVDDFDAGTLQHWLDCSERRHAASVSRARCW
jgi:hypothetical protein